MELIVRTLGNAAGLWLAARFMSGLTVPGDQSAVHTWVNLIVVGLILALVNSLVKPVVKTLALPIYVLTFGLFALVVNGAMLMLTSWLTDKVSWLGAGSGVALVLFCACWSVFLSSPFWLAAHQMPPTMATMTRTEAAATPSGLDFSARSRTRSSRSKSRSASSRRSLFLVDVFLATVFFLDGDGKHEKHQDASSIRCPILAVAGFKALTD